MCMCGLTNPVGIVLVYLFSLEGIGNWTMDGAPARQALYP